MVTAAVLAELPSCEKALLAKPDGMVLWLSESKKRGRK
jgi:hypothetical protein